jgi:hypothetical protein
MKNLVQCRKLEAKFRQLAVSDPASQHVGTATGSVRDDQGSGLWP